MASNPAACVQHESWCHRSGARGDNSERASKGEVRGRKLGVRIVILFVRGPRIRWNTLQ
jgi:hypothetical protein